MKRKRLMIWSVAIVLAVALALPAGTLNAAKRRYVSIAAGWVTGAYFPMAGAISRIAWKHLKEDGIKVTAESSGASVANAKLIGTGDTDFTILQNEIASYAYQGKEGMWFRTWLLWEKDLPAATVPLSAVGVKGVYFDAVCANGGGFTHGGTFSHHPVAAAAGLALVRIIERERLVERVVQLAGILGREIATPDEARQIFNLPVPPV